MWLNLDVVICSRSAMDLVPTVVSIGSESALGTVHLGICPPPGKRAPKFPDDCDCGLKPMSDHQLITFEVKGSVSTPRVTRPDKRV